MTKISTPKNFKGEGGQGR